MIWPHATIKNPCPICGKTDWCSFGDKAMLCQRIASEHAHPKGGWFHFYETAKPISVPPPRKFVPPSTINFGNLSDRFRNEAKLIDLAIQLGVSIGSLESLHAGWSNQYRAWTFPMRDASGKIIGMQLRGEQKRSITGSRLGLFIPQIDPQPVVYLPEGASDTAAFLSMGLYAIGRPSCNAGNEMVAEFLKLNSIFKAVVVADRDEIKAGGNRPGSQGALKLKMQLKVSSVFWIPPNKIKDVREFYRLGGTKEIIESQVKNKVWSKI